jgi:hypothetical protein
MPPQALLPLIKKCQFYLPRGEYKKVGHITRGVYVLHRKKSAANQKKVFEVFYIGVAGVAKKATSGIQSRLRSHDKTKEDWTHFSFYEVHDNVSGEQIRELEDLFLRIFRHDPRVKLDNKQHGSKALWHLSKLP